MIKLSLRSKLILGTVLIQSTVLAIIIYNANRIAQDFLKEQVRIRVETIIPLLNSAVSGPLAQHDYATLAEILNEIHRTHAIDQISVMDSDGRVVSEVGVTESEDRRQTDGGLEDTNNDGHIDKEMAVTIDGRVVGKLTFGMSIDFLQAARDSLANQNGLIAITGLLLASVLVSILSWWLTRNLMRLRMAADRIAKGEYGTETGISPAEHDEIAQLAQSFDDMSRQIKGQNEGLLQEIDERKKAELTLRQFKAIIDSSDDAIIGATQDSTIMSWNSGAESLFGYPATETIGRSMRMLIPAERGDEEGQILARIARGDRIVHFETLRQHRNGQLIHVSATISPILDEDGKVIGISRIARDITERKRVEAELEKHRHHLEALVEERTAALSIAKEAAEAANRAKSTFLSNMSHELRTPMNAIMGMAGMALRHAEDPKLRDQLGKIDKASQHLLAVINDILDISKIEAERLALEHTDFMLGEVLENVSSLIAHKAADKGLKLRIDLPPEISRLALQGDPLRLGQILLNLAANAVKFTAAGTVILRADLAKTSPTDVLLRFEVQDTGIGISPADQKRLFTAFEQADGSMTRKYGGTGLGLAISKRLAGLMGGDIGVVSEPGAGSTFWFTVRLGRAPGANTAALPVPAVSTRSADEKLLDEYAGTRVLLAEDEPINQEVSRDLLEDAGLAVDLAEDGVVAVEMAKRNRYSLILMDMQMPQLNGVDATRAIRALPGYEHTPILAMTANAFDEDRQVCIDAGMNDHIGKPVDPEKLFETLLRWLSTPCA